MNRLCSCADALVALAILLCGGVARGQNPRAAEAVDLGGGVTMSLVRLEAGMFNQGSPETEPGRAADEVQRSVTLTRPFYIGKFPVTVGQYVRFVAETRYRTEAETGTSGGYGWDGTKLIQKREFTWRNPGFVQTDEHPVVLVTYPDAEAFAAWLSRKSGRKFQLPTEAQWEYSCRAGTTGAFPFGESRQDAGNSIWHKANSGNGTQPVGRMKSNAWGIHDMLGQVWEWCQDMYGPYQSGAVVDPVALQPGPGERPRRVLRGGSWLKDLDSCRAATRYRNDPRSRNADNGFRVVTFDELPAVPRAQPTVVPPVTEPKLEREDDTVRSTGPTETGPVHRPIERRSSKKGVSAIGLIVGLAVVFIVFRIVRSLLRATLSQPAETVGSLLSAAPNRGGHSGPISTRIVEDGFWIQSGELPPGALVTCRYTIDAGPQETNIRFEPGSEGHFVYTGSRPRSVSVVVAPGGGPTHITREPPLRRKLRDDDDDDARFRGFPPAY